MEKFKVSFVANNQQLTATGTKHASDTYADIEATFTLGERWTDMDSVSAVWWNDFTRIATVLDSEGKCTVPHEVLTRKGCVRVNLVGSVVEDGELVTRLTSYSAEAVHVNEKIKLTGNEPQTITPSQYEQFVANVKADADRAESAKESAETASASAQGYAQSASASASSASESATLAEQAKQSAQASAQNAQISAQTAENAKDDAELARDEILGMRATATTLEEGSQATANYSNGVLSLGIPRGDTGATGAKGDKGDTGATPNLTIGNVETLEPTESATATITGTAENPVLNLGIPQGDTGEVSLADLSTLLPTDTASGEIASFPDGQSVIPLLSLLADIEPIQSGSGTPSPDNIRPISGHTEVNTIVSPTQSASDGTTYTTDLGRTVYGGTLDVVSGELVVDRAITLVTVTSSLAQDTDLNGYHRFYFRKDDVAKRTNYVGHIIASACPTVPNYAYFGTFDGEMAVTAYSVTSIGANYLYIISKSLSTVAEVQAQFAETPLQIVYELATPQTIQLTPQEVYALLGENNVWADSGEVEVVYKADVTKWVEKKLS